MGFTTAFLGSITLTSSIIYLSLAAHKRNRLEQSLVLRESALRLRRVVDPSTIPTIVEPYQNRNIWREIAKKRWNEEMEGLAKQMQNIDLTRFRELVEDRVVRAWEKFFEQVEKSPKESP